MRLLSICCFFFCLVSLQAEESLISLLKKQSSRQAVLKKLKEAKPPKVKEDYETWEISAAGKLSSTEKKLLADENADRRLIAKKLLKPGKTLETVLKERGARQREIDEVGKNMQVLFKVHGSANFAEYLGPRLARYFLRNEGYTGVTRRQDDVNARKTFVIGAKDNAQKFFGIEFLSSGGDQALTDLKEKACDLAAETNATQGKAIASDALALLVHPGNKLNRLDKATVASILTGQAVRWSALPGESFFGGRKAAGSLPVYISGQNKQAIKQLQQWIGAAMLSNRITYLNTDQEVDSKVFQTPSALGVVSMGVLLHSSNKPVALEGYRPTALTVKKGLYPIRQKVSVSLREGAPELAEKFATFIQSKEAYEPVVMAGFVPLVPYKAPVEHQAAQAGTAFIPMNAQLKAVYTDKKLLELTRDVLKLEKETDPFVVSGFLQEQAGEGRGLLKAVRRSPQAELAAAKLNAARAAFFARLPREKQLSFIEKAHQRRSALSLPADKEILHLAGASYVGRKLLVPLAEAFLQEQKGFDQIIQKAEGNTVKILARRTGDKEFQSISLKLGSTADGVTALKKKQCELAILGREEKGKATSTDFQHYAYVSVIGYEALVVVVAGGYAAEDIAESALKGQKVFASTASQGADDGGVVAILQANLGRTASPQLQSVDTVSKVVQAVKADAEALGILTYSQWSLLEEKGGLKALKLKGKTSLAQEPTRLAIKTGNYPLSQSYALAVAAGRSPLAQEFRLFAASERGQQIVRLSGMVDQGSPSDSDRHEADVDKASLLRDSNLDAAYKALLQPLDRYDTPFNIRFAQSGTFAVDLYENLDLTVNANIQRLIRRMLLHNTQESTLVLAGHTDSDPPGAGLKAKGIPDNATLGFKRAEALARELTAMGFNVEPVTLDQHSLADRVPVSGNNARNRRIEIFIRR